MKKVIAFLLTVLIVFAMVGCSTSPTENPEPLPPMLSDTTEEEYDLYGYQCVMYYQPGTLYGPNTIFWYRAGTSFYDIAAKRLADIKKNLNCDFVTIYYDDSGRLISDIAKAQATLAGSPDITIQCIYTNVKNLCRGGLLLPLDEFGDLLPIHDESVYGPANIQEPALFNGHPYMVIPYTHPERQLLQDYFLTFNETLFAEYNVPDLRSVYEQKQWTWDYFKGFLSDYTVKEQDKTVIYGLASCDFLPNFVLASNGFKLAYKDESGNYVSGTTAPNVLQSIDFIRELKTNYKDCIVDCYDFQYAVDKMINGNAYFCINQLANLISTIQYEVERFGVLPFPYGPSGEYGKSLSDPEIFGAGICTSSDEPDGVARILNAYCQPFDEYPTADSALEIYKMMFFDERDISTLKELTKTVRYLYWGGEGHAYLCNAIETYATSKSSEEIVASVSGIMEQVVEDFILPNVDYVDTYFTK